jgi:peroxiredoxin
MSDDMLASPGNSNPTKRIDILLLALLLGSLSLNVYLGWYTVDLKNSLRSRQDSSKLVPGTAIQPISVSDLNGKSEIISYADGGKPTVLYVLSPMCDWCERNMQNIQTLARLKGESFRFVGISLADTNLKEYVEGHHINFPVYKNITSDGIHMLALGSTPQTIVISPEGRVLKNWMGAYRGNSQSEVEAYFDVKLPGLTSGSD